MVNVNYNMLFAYNLGRKAEKLSQNDNVDQENKLDNIVNNIALGSMDIVLGLGLLINTYA